MDSDSYLIVGIIFVTILNLAPNLLAMRQLFGGKLRQEITPSPLEVKEEKQPVNEGECELRMAANKDAHLRMHDDINRIDREVAGLCATVELNGQRLVQMDGKLDQLLRKS